MAKWIKLLNTHSRVLGLPVLGNVGTEREINFLSLFVTPRFEKLTLALQSLYVFQQKTSINKVI